LEETSCDGGLLLLKEVDNQIGLINRLSDCLHGTRHQSYMKHIFKVFAKNKVSFIKK